MKLKYLSILPLLLITGCASTYIHSELRPIEAKLDINKGVLISTPKDGVYGNTQYQNSGKMTASVIKEAFSKHALKVDLVDNCSGDRCLKNIDAIKYGYYVMPTILQWEDRATAWSGLPDRIEVKIEVYDAKTSKELSSASYTGKSKWMTLGGDNPQDLLSVPTNKYVNGLYGVLGSE